MSVSEAQNGLSVGSGVAYRASFTTTLPTNCDRGHVMVMAT